MCQYETVHNWCEQLLQNDHIKGIKSLNIFLFPAGRRYTYCGTKVIFCN